MEQPERPDDATTDVMSKLNVRYEYTKYTSNCHTVHWREIYRNLLYDRIQKLQENLQYDTKSAREFNLQYITKCTK